MRRLPILATLVVAAAVATMIGLGLWQLQRAGEKKALLADYAAAAELPPLDLDPLLADEARPPPPLAFRRVRVTCRAREVAPELRGGRSAAGQGGYVHLLACRPGASGLAGRLRVDAGWSPQPQELRLTLDRRIEGVLGMVREEGPIVVTAAEPAPPLAPSAAPRLDQVPDNHLAYAFQWFFFAGAALVIYALALRRRLSRAPQVPKSPAR